MSLRTRFGYPVGIAAALVGALRQSQRWLPRYEWVQPHQLGAYIAAINLSVLIVGAVSAFALGIRADRHLGHQWELSAAIPTAVVASVVGMGTGTMLTFVVQPSLHTVTLRPLIAFIGPMVVYVITQGVPIGFVGIAGLASSRIHALETVDTARSDTEFAPIGSAEPTEVDADAEPTADTDSLGSQ